MMVKTGIVNGMRITERDREMVEAVARYGVMEEEMVRRWWFGTRQAAYRRLKMLVDSGLLAHDRVLHNRPGVYRATKAGIVFAGLELHPAGINLQHLEHSLELVNLAEKLQKENPGATYYTERELRSEATRAALSEKTNLIMPEPERSRMPDGLLILQDGGKVAVELELSPKRNRLYERYVKEYARSRRDYDEVRFYFTRESARRRAEDIARKSKTSEWMKFYGYRPGEQRVDGEASEGVPEEEYASG